MEIRAGRLCTSTLTSFNSQKRLSEQILRSLNTQLSRCSIKRPAALEKSFSNSQNPKQQPFSVALLLALWQSIKEDAAAYIVLDALDECNDRVELLEALETIANWQLENLHVLVTSRRERDIELSLEPFVDPKNTVSLQSNLVDGVGVLNGTIGA